MISTLNFDQQLNMGLFSELGQQKIMLNGIGLHFGLGLG